MNAIIKADSPHEIMESVLIKGDLSKLTAEERNSYYRAVCASVGLNPLTKPLEYITLNGKLRLYALKDCTDQLRSIHGISVTDLAETDREGVFVVKAKVANAQGRTDVSTGAVNIQGLKGEALANALMKAETKAKRRATLSICGLGLLDETEVDDIPTSQKAHVERSRVPSPTQITHQPQSAPEPPQGPRKIVGGTFAEWADEYIAAVQTSDAPDVVMKWVDLNATLLAKLAKGSPPDSVRVKKACDAHLAFLRKTAPKDDPISSGPQRSKSIPSADTDYDGLMTYVADRIAKIASAEDLEALFNDATIGAELDKLMPPDRSEMQGLFDKKMREFE